MTEPRQPNRDKGKAATRRSVKPAATDMQTPTGAQPAQDQADTVPPAGTAQDDAAKAAASAGGHTTAAKRKRAAPRALDKPSMPAESAASDALTPDQTDTRTLSADDGESAAALPFVDTTGTCNSTSEDARSIARAALPRPASLLRQRSGTSQAITPSSADLATQLQAWQQQQADRLDPLRFARMQTLYRRSVALRGMAQELVVQRLQALMDGYAAELASKAGPPDAASQPQVASIGHEPKGPTGTGDSVSLCATDSIRQHQADSDPGRPDCCDQAAPANSSDTAVDPAESGSSTATPAPSIDTLALLVQILDQRRRQHAAEASAPLTARGHAGSSDASYPDPLSASAAATMTPAPPPVASIAPAPLQQDIQALRQLWDHVRNQSQLRHAASPAPSHAGPLNSATLVHRAIQLMRDLSPGYLRHFLAYVDDLAWLGQLQGDTGIPTKPAPAILSSRRGGKTKPGKSGH